MTRIFGIVCVLGAAFSSLSFSQEAPQAVKTEPANVSKSNGNWWTARHELLKKNLEAAPCDLLFIGDSITHQWESGGKKVWDKDFAPYSPANFGIGGDRTEHVLWRIDDSALKTQHSPQVCVIHIGTNNTGVYKGAQPAAETAAGILEIAARVHKLHPATEIILLHIFPRGSTKDDPLRLHNEAINKELDKADMPRVHVVNINDKFLNPDGTFLPGTTGDLLHFTEKGYQIWADALLPEIKKYMK